MDSTELEWRQQDMVDVGSDVEDAATVTQGEAELPAQWIEQPTGTSGEIVSLNGPQDAAVVEQVAESVAGTELAVRDDPHLVLAGNINNTTENTGDFLTELERDSVGKCLC